MTAELEFDGEWLDELLAADLDDGPVSPPLLGYARPATAPARHVDLWRAIENTTPIDLYEEAQ